MAENLRSRWRQALSTTAILFALGSVILVSPPSAQSTTPVEIGVAQPPLVTIIFDTSASMEWGQEGDHHYPSLDPGDAPSGGNHLETWSAGSRLYLPSSMYPDEVHGRVFIDQDDSSRAVSSVGPCMVWHPMTSSGSAQCNNYERPHPCAEADDCGGYIPSYTSGMSDRLQEMRDHEQMRLSGDYETPRHIQVKQILTGDMHLTHTNNSRPGPGCWFVPRARGVLNGEQVCCEAWDDDDLRCTNSSAQSFEYFVDYQDPIPHYQEVYNEQIQNGLLDAMGSTAIFSVVMFDGFRGDGRRSGGWNHRINDIIAGNSPYAGGVTLPTGASGVEGGDCDGFPCYDLGIYRFIGPTHLDLTEDELRLLSNYVQDAIKDAGYLFEDDLVLDEKRQNDEGESFSLPVFEYPLGKQAMAQASPFGPVFHDLHQFFMHGQYEDEHATSGVGINPIDDDEYFACRGRHIVMFTDGRPEPEAPGGAGQDSSGRGLGNERLSPEFGNIPSHFPYVVTEDAISMMIAEAEARILAETGEAASGPFIPRVHVLAVSQEEDATMRDRIIDKVATMAEKGKTCAQYYLPASMIPIGSNTGQVDEDGVVGWVEGTCDVNDEDTVCLVEQNLTGYTYTPPDESAMDFPCEHPALMLSRNDRESLVRAFQLIFNEISGASGLAARTRPSITNYIDRDDKAGQYRIFSGLEVEGSNMYWRGVLNRQLMECNLSLDDQFYEPSEMRRLHQDLNRLRLAPGSSDEEIPIAPDDGVDEDRRRLFTSWPRFLMGASQTETTGGNDVSEFFNFSYRLFEGPNDDFDTFQIGGFETGVIPEKTRIPFEHDDLWEAFDMIGTFDEEDFYEYWKIAEPDDMDMNREDYFKLIIDRYRGRIGELADRVLGGILNSNPITVGPPDMDLPIDSYREFRRLYFDRPTMTYVSTVDGLLHAIYSGEPEVQVRDLDGEETKGDAYDQREAWAYLPHLLHGDIADKWRGAHQLMDGSPVVTDIRLCHGVAARNTNERACPAATIDGTSMVPPAAQWRTVLVQGLGTGPGYFALDVTRPGTPDDPPDPIVLWEFGPQWERMQLEELEGQDSWRFEPQDPTSYKDALVECTGLTEVEDCTLPEHNCGNTDLPEAWDLSYLGTSGAEAAVGTVAMKVSEDLSVQRPVAIFGGGSNVDAEAYFPQCTNEITGKAIYVVDLQSGELIRRFIDYRDDSDHAAFPSAITGTPVLSAVRPGEVSTRAFIGDQRGRLFRLDMSYPDPEAWEVEVFFDPADPAEAGFMPDLPYAERDSFGPASFRPAVTTGLNRELVIIYGLGQRGDTGGTNSLQAIIALEEQRDVATNRAADAKELWRQVFDEDGERLTGAPVIFDGDIFFTTYVEPEDRCVAGDARIYRLRYDGKDPADPTADTWPAPVGGWVGFQDDNGDFNVDTVNTPPRWFGPVDPTMIRGLAITMGPICNELGDDETTGTVRDSPPPQPQLIAQAGSADVGDGGGGTGAGSGGGGDISRITVDLEAPSTRSVPLSWTIIGN